MTELIVNEIFLSINGETSTMGMPTTFVRLAGCNLNCWGGCDTEHALAKNAGTLMKIHEIIAVIKDLACPRVCITGGEPLLEENKCIELINQLLALENREISVETNGSFSLKTFKERFGNEIRFTMDLKPPSSGMRKEMMLDNLTFLEPTDEIKFVIAEYGDFAWATDIIRTYQPKARLLFSPMYERLAPKELVDWVLQERLWASRVQLQLHKYIWSPDEKGV